MSAVKWWRWQKRWKDEGTVRSESDGGNSQDSSSSSSSSEQLNDNVYNSIGGMMMGVAAVVVWRWLWWRWNDGANADNNERWATVTERHTARTFHPGHRKQYGPSTKNAFSDRQHCNPIIDEMLAEVTVYAPWDLAPGLCLGSAAHPWTYLRLILDLS